MDPTGGSHAYLARVPPRHSSAQELRPAQAYQSRGYSQEFASQYWNHAGYNQPRGATAATSPDAKPAARPRRSMWEARNSNDQAPVPAQYAPTAASVDNLYMSSTQVSAGKGRSRRRRSDRYEPANASYSGSSSMQDISASSAGQSSHFRFSSVDNGAMPRTAADQEVRSPSFTSSTGSLVSPHYTSSETSLTTTGTQASPLYSPRASDHTNDSSQYYGKTNTVYPSYVVRKSTTPYYNTGTQTQEMDVRTSVSEPQHTAVSSEEKCVQVRPESLVNNSYQVSQLDSALSMLNEHNAERNNGYQEMQTQATSPMSPTGPGHPKSETGASHRVCSIIESMEQKNRIPATIQEVSHEDRSSSHQQQDFRINNDDLAKIHEYSPSQTDMLRKLSQAFYPASDMSARAKMKAPSGDAGQHPQPGIMRERAPKLRSVQWAVENNLPVPSRHEKSDSGFCSREASQDQGAWQENTILSDEDVDNPNSASPFERRAKVQMSMRKAYGIFDEVESIGDMKKKQSNLLSVDDGEKTSPPQATAGKAHVKSSDAPKTHKKKGFLDKLKGHSSKSDSVEVLESMPKEPEPATPTKQHSSKLRRTTSEQIRPVKEKEKKEKRSKKHRTSDPKDVNEKKHKGSDPTDAQAQVTAPSQASLSTDRLASDSDSVFHEPDAAGVSMRASTGMPGRSMSGSSLDDSVQLRQHQQNAVAGFYERKTGKSVSASSMDGSLSASERPPSGTRHSSFEQRSPSPAREKRDKHRSDKPSKSRKAKGMKKSVSLPRNVCPPESAEATNMPHSMSFTEQPTSSSLEVSPAAKVESPLSHSRPPGKPPRLGQVQVGSVRCGGHTQWLSSGSQTFQVQCEFITLKFDRNMA